MCVCVCVCAKLLQSWPTWCNPMDHSPPGCSVHGILQEKVLEWIAMPFSRGSSWPRDRTRISYIFPTQGSNLHLLHLLNWQVGPLPLAPPGKPWNKRVTEANELGPEWPLTTLSNSHPVLKTCFFEPRASHISWIIKLPSSDRVSYVWFWVPF